MRKQIRIIVIEHVHVDFFSFFHRKFGTNILFVFLLIENLFVLKVKSVQLSIGWIHWRKTQSCLQTTSSVYSFLAILLEIPIRTTYSCSVSIVTSQSWYMDSNLSSTWTNRTWMATMCWTTSKHSIDFRCTYWSDYWYHSSRSKLTLCTRDFSLVSF